VCTEILDVRGLSGSGGTFLHFSCNRTKSDLMTSIHPSKRFVILQTVKNVYISYRKGTAEQLQASVSGICSMFLILLLIGWISDVCSSKMLLIKSFIIKFYSSAKQWQCVHI
jgi:hypothetical protein